MWKNRGVKKENSRGRGAFCAASILCAVMLLTACAGENAAGQQDSTGQIGADSAAEQDADWLAERVKYDRRTKHDLRTEPEDRERMERIDLDVYENGKVLLTASGDIWLSGSLEGQLIIDAEEDELVHLYLAGVEITSRKGPALWVQEAAKVVVTLVSGTENVLADSPDYTDCEEAPACLYSVCDLTFNGGGVLQAYGYYEDCIRSKDRLKLLDGTFSLQAKGDGIRGNDGIYMRDASVDIESEKNGLRTVNQGADERGVIEIDGGTISVIAGQNGIWAAADLYVYHGRCSVNAVEEKLQAGKNMYIADGEQGL